MRSCGIELMAPAGDWASLSAALRAGADSVYFGVGDLNMRARAAGNFAVEDLPKIAAYCRKAGVFSYLTLNTVLFNRELTEAARICESAKAAGIDALIAADPAVIRIANRVGIPVHMSVQANISNLESVRFWAPYAEVMVLARELSLADIREIIRGIREENIVGSSGKLIRIELFAHGALCVAFSGKCNMSLALYGADTSANRGRCQQPCRRIYHLHDPDTGSELEVDGHYIMSPKDICTVNRLDEILDAGVSVLKLEGRGRSPDYVGTVTGVYCRAINAWARGDFEVSRREGRWIETLSTVFNRGFWEGGYYLGLPLGEWTNFGGSKAAEQKVYVGNITKYFSKLGVAECDVRAAVLNLNDEIWIIGKTTGALRLTILELHIGDEGIPAEQAVQGTVAAFKVPEKVRRGDAVYLIRERLDG